MIVWAALDLRANRVVQLVGGNPEAERVSLPDPVAVARHWVDEGFEALHVVDLDAALGEGDNRAAILAILAAVSVPVQVGGGLRDDEAVARVLDAGAARAIIGTRAVEDRAWIEALVARHPGRIVVAADVRAGSIVTRGWRAAADIAGEDFLRELDPLDLAGVLVTDVTHEGQLTGVDVARFRSLVSATEHPFIAAGGIANIEDLRMLESAGAAGAVLGMSLYTGSITAESITREFIA
jgi:phosphoribosylformimino-5-aminoimidazole carboxamide ribotide isomerase